MKNEMMQKMAAVVNALNTVTICGEQNMRTLSGSIGVLKELVTELQQYDLVKVQHSEKSNKN